MKNNKKNHAIDNPRVVHIIDRLPPDGAERLLVDVLKNRSDKFNFTVICLVEGGSLVKELEEIGVPVIIMGKCSKYDIKILFKLILLLRKIKPIVVHTHLFTADTWGRVAAFLSHVPCIINTVHSTNTWKGAIHRIIDQILSLVSNKIIACSDEVAVVLKKSFKISNNKIIVISNGIDLNRFEIINSIKINEIDKFSNDILKIAIIGRLHPAKGHFDLVKAITILSKTYSNFHVFLIGEGELKESINSECNINNINGLVSFLGQRSDIPQILSKIDIFVMPSHWEGLPMALLEAMAMSKAIVATKVGGIPDVIKDGENGLLINKSDYKELASKIEQLLLNKELRLKLGNEAKNTILKYYTAKNVSFQYENLYKNIVGNL